PLRGEIEMTDSELKMLKADITAEVIKELTGKDLRTAQDTSRPLAQVYARYKDSLYKKFGIVTYAQAWDSIRKLATFRAGHRYVRDLLPSEEAEAAEFAESIILQLGIEEQS
ncbi:hypothetical protein M5X00_32455, partial [Paenibacillus alvei]